MAPWSNLMTRQNILAACVFIDLFAVSLIVPLLPFRYKELGISPVQIGMMGSVYSVAQIFGGIAFGFLSDRVEDRRSVLLVSFFGAALSYAMVGAATSIWVLGASRVVVGAVKQTMTASKAMASEWSDEANRAASLGIVTSAATAAWVVGSGVTATLQRLHPAAPSAVAVGLYAVDAVVVLWLLPPTHTSSLSSPSSSSFLAATTATGAAGAAKGAGPPDALKPRPGFLASCRQAFGNGRVGRFLAIKVAFDLVSRSGSSLQDVWEMDRFGLKMGQLGALRTAKSLITVATQGFVAGRVTRALGERATFAAALILTLVG